MLPLVILGGALYYLSRPRRNPDWITVGGKHRPLRAGDGRSGDPTPYDPARVGETGTARATRTAASAPTVPAPATRTVAAAPKPPRVAQTSTAVAGIRPPFLVRDKETGTLTVQLPPLATLKNVSKIEPIRDAMYDWYRQEDDPIRAWYDAQSSAVGAAVNTQYFDAWQLLNEIIKWLKAWNQLSSDIAERQRTHAHAADLVTYVRTKQRTVQDYRFVGRAGQLTKYPVLVEWNTWMRHNWGEAGMFAQAADDAATRWEQAQEQKQEEENAAASNDAVTLSGREFHRAVKAGAWATVKEEDRPTLMNVNVVANGRELIVQSADGYRVARGIVNVSGGTRFNVEVSPRALTTLANALRTSSTVSLYAGARAGTGWLFVTGADKKEHLLQDLGAGKYPDLARVIPSGSTWFMQADSSKLKEALTTLKPTWSTANDAVGISRTADGIEVAAARGDGKQWVWEGVNVPASSTGASNEPRTLINAKWLLEMLPRVGKFIRMGFNKPTGPVRIFGDDEAATTLIMPMNLPKAPK